MAFQKSGFNPEEMYNLSGGKVELGGIPLNGGGTDYQAGQNRHIPRRMYGDFNYSIYDNVTNDLIAVVPTAHAAEMFDALYHDPQYGSYNGNAEATAKFVSKHECCPVKIF